MLPFLAFLSTQAWGQDMVVVGKMVKNSQGVTLGKVQNVVLSDRGCVEYIVLSGEFSGARDRYYPVPWNIVRSASGDTLVTDIDVAVLKDAPVIETLNDATLSQWRPKAHDFYAEHKMSAYSEKPGDRSAREMARQQTSEERQDKALERKDEGKRHPRDIFQPPRTDELMQERAQKDRGPEEMGQGKFEKESEVGRDRSRTDPQMMQREKFTGGSGADRENRFSESNLSSQKEPDLPIGGVGPKANTE